MTTDEEALQPHLGAAAGRGDGGRDAWLILGFSLMGMTFDPMGALPPELFPANVRYAGSGIAHSVSSILGATVASFIAVARRRGQPLWVGVCLSSMTLITLIAAHRPRDQEHRFGGVEPARRQGSDG